MHHWISLLQKPKRDSKCDGQEFLVRGVLLICNLNLATKYKCTFYVWMIGEPQYVLESTSLLILEERSNQPIRFEGCEVLACMSYFVKSW